jgi:hypothetical protein
MKLIQGSDKNRNKIKMSQREWQSIGQKAGWIKKSQEEPQAGGRPDYMKYDGRFEEPPYDTEEKPQNEYYQIEGPIELKKTEKWADNYLVQYPVSYRYNGGIVSC